MRRIITIVVLGLMVTGAYAQTTVEWFSTNATTAISPSGAAVLSGADASSGALFQLFVASGGVVHSPTAADFGTGTGATGGDTYLDSTFANINFGSGVAYVGATPYAALAITDYVYIRIWDRATSGGGNLPASFDYGVPGVGGYYYQTAAVQVQTLEKPDWYSYAFTPPSAAGQWTFLPVPEPASMALGLLGLGVILIRRRLMRK